MKFKNIIIIPILLYSFSVFAARWTVLIYMEPGAYKKADALHDAAWRNINDLARANISNDVNILVQFHGYDQFAWRYKIEKGVVRQLDTAELDNYYDDMRSAFAWAYTNYPAQNYGLIWWGRGCGILEPSWQDHQIDFEDDEAFDICLSCPRSVPVTAKRAILLESASQQYVSNEDMVNLLQGAAELIGKKLNFVGLDCCLGAALEHAYQMAPYVDYMLGCQNCELPDGYEYYGLANRLSDPNNSMVDIVKGIVADYGAYYAQRTQLQVYTLAALDCACSERSALLIKKLVEQLCDALKQEPILQLVIKDTIIHKCPHFCFVPMYTDTYGVATALIDSINNDPLWQTCTMKEDILETLSALQKVIERMVIANTTGNNMTAAHGVSIYWPLSHIDSSYFKTSFAQDTQWPTFLQMMHA
jgi:hypothetical protein